MLIRLDNSLQPLIEVFNRDSPKHRFITLLSPTWPKWINDGTRAVHEGILSSFPDADLDVLVVWTGMMGSDTYEAAQEAVGKFKDGRVKQFFDPQQMAGKAVATSLGHDGKVAWDFYLFYPVQSEWRELPPAPEVFMHQLRNGWADQNRLFENDKLKEKLTETMKLLFP